MDIKLTKIERITVTCPMDKRVEAVNYVYDNGYTKVLRSGPKSNGDYTVDMNVFHIVADKEIK
jgi:hypothetical protein